MERESRTRAISTDRSNFSFSSLSCSLRVTVWPCVSVSVSVSRCCVCVCMCVIVCTCLRIYYAETGLRAWINDSFLSQLPLLMRGATWLHRCILNRPRVLDEREIDQNAAAAKVEGDNEAAHRNPTRVNTLYPLYP